MEIIVAAADGTVLDKVTFILREKVKKGIVRIGQCSEAAQLAGILRSQPPEILIVFTEQVTTAVISSIGLIDPGKTAVVAVIPEQAGDIFFKIQQYPVRWYLPERHLGKHLNGMIEKSGELLRKEREIRTYRIQQLYEIENEFKRIILTEFDGDPGIQEYQRFIRFFSRAGLHSCAFILKSGTWAFFCTDESESEARRNILYLKRYFGSTDRRVRFAVSERIGGFDEFVKKPRLLSEILAMEEDEDGKRIFYEKDYMIKLRGNVRPSVCKACMYVERNYKKRIRVGEIAVYCYLSSNYLSEIFKKDMGIKLTAYIEQIRMEHAVRLITEGEKMIKDIALICGFHDSSHFSNRFKTVYGMSPRKYRENDKKARSRRMSSARVIL